MTNDIHERAAYKLYEKQAHMMRPDVVRTPSPEFIAGMREVLSEIYAPLVARAALADELAAALTALQAAMANELNWGLLNKADKEATAALAKYDALGGPK